MTHHAPRVHALDKVFLVRNQRVMLDKDLARFYGMEPIRLREKVKKNMARFPEDFMFQLSVDEVKLLLSQGAIPSKKHLGGFLPYAFTDKGAIMLAYVLGSERAVRLSTRLIELYGKTRALAAPNKEISARLEQLERKAAGHDRDIQFIFSYLKEMMDLPEPQSPVMGFRGRGE